MRLAVLPLLSLSALAQTYPCAPREPVPPPDGPRAEVGKPLPILEVKDLEGRTWTLTDLEGRTTLVNLWATWCGPCVQELPYVQKLYERIQSHRGMQVLTLNVDRDVEKVQPFLEKHNYTFPVLLARSYVKALFPTLSIPRNWITDKTGTLREETVGFGGSGNQWVENVLAKLRD
jgi:thiol-disulfide isomerase/thioredoxin